MHAHHGGGDDCATEKALSKCLHLQSRLSRVPVRGGETPNGLTVTPIDAAASNPSHSEHSDGAVRALSLLGMHAADDFMHNEGGDVRRRPVAIVRLERREILVRRL